MSTKTKTTKKTQEEWIAQAALLSEALPYMRRHAGGTFVIKYGGHAMGDAALAHLFAHDVVLLKQVGMIPVVVHGGGPQIGKMLDRLDIETQFIDGLRVTCEETVTVAEMVLSGSINKHIVSAINQAGGMAVGLSGKDGNLIQARKMKKVKRDPDSERDTLLDLGWVGEPESIDPHILRVLQETDVIPVVAPIGRGSKGETFNINADTAAGAIAAKLSARRLLLLTDVEGVKDKKGKLISKMTASEARAYIADGTIQGGMIPKVETCLQSLQSGVQGAVIIDGRVPHAVLLELFTEHGAGTLIVHDEA